MSETWSRPARRRFHAELPLPEPPSVVEAVKAYRATCAEARAQALEIIEEAGVVPDGPECAHVAHAAWSTYRRRSRPAWNRLKAELERLGRLPLAEDLYRSTSMDIDGPEFTQWHTRCMKARSRVVPPKPSGHTRSSEESTR